MSKKRLILNTIFILFLLSSCFSVSSKEFTNNNISITLTNKFKEQKKSNELLYLTSKEIIFIGNQEKVEDVGEMSLKEYTELVLKNASETVKITSDIESYSDENTSFMYTSYVEEASKNSYSYLLTTFKTTSYYYACNFITKQDKYDDLKDQLFIYAKTIKVN